MFRYAYSNSPMSWNFQVLFGWCPLWNHHFGWEEWEGRKVHSNSNGGVTPTTPMFRKINQNTWTSQILRRNSTMDGWDMHPVIISQEYGVVMCAYTFFQCTPGRAINCWLLRTHLFLYLANFLPKKTVSLSKANHSSHSTAMRCGTVNGRKHGTHRSETEAWQNHRLQSHGKFMVRCCWKFSVQSSKQNPTDPSISDTFSCLLKCFFLFHLTYVSFDWKVDPKNSNPMESSSMFGV